MTVRRLVLAFVLGFAALPLAGCGSSTAPAPLPDYGSEDGLKVAQLVSEFNEAKADQAKFKKMFAGSPTADWRKYYPLSFEVVVGSPKVTGAEATAQVTVRKDADNSEVGKKEWTFAKSGDAWKIKTAPLP